MSGRGFLPFTGRGSRGFLVQGRGSRGSTVSFRRIVHEGSAHAARRGGCVMYIGHGAATATTAGRARRGPSAAGAAAPRVHSGRPEDPRRRPARLPAVPRRLEQAPHQPRRHRRRSAALSVSTRARGGRRARHLQGRRRLSQHGRSRHARQLPAPGRRVGEPPRRAVRTRPQRSSRRLSAAPRSTAR